MDHAYYELLGNTAYVQCFRKVFKTPVEATEDHEAQLNQCLQNFVNSYKHIGKVWTRYVSMQPDIERLSPPQLDEDE